MKNNTNQHNSRKEKPPPVSQKIARLACGATAVLAALLTTATPALAAPPAPPEPTILTFPANVACDFELKLEAVGTSKVVKDFVDKNGLPARLLIAGKGVKLTFSTPINNSTYVLAPNGSVNHTTYGPGGTSTVHLSGHNVLILYPTDIPAGPSTIQYVGNVTYTVDAAGVFRVTSTSGRQVDICAALAN